jgi:hypothetical protein
MRQRERDRSGYPGPGNDLPSPLERGTLDLHPASLILELGRDRSTGRTEQDNR